MSEAERIVYAILGGKEATVVLKESKKFGRRHFKKDVPYRLHLNKVYGGYEEIYFDDENEERESLTKVQARIIICCNIESLVWTK